MALPPAALRIIAPLLRNASVLSFGYPDLLMTLEEAGKILGNIILLGSSPHGAAHKLNFPIADTLEAFAAVGAKLTCVDLMPSRGAEMVLDLNFSQNFNYKQFDLVIDPGTIEHCANIGQALMNAAEAVRPNGHVFHAPPLSMVNHGFYNICPTLLVDFYEQNGWTVKHLSAFSRKYPYQEIKNIPAHIRFVPSSELCLMFLAQRMSVTPLHWPIQHKYLPTGEAA